MLGYLCIIFNKHLSKLLEKYYLHELLSKKHLKIWVNDG